MEYKEILSASQVMIQFKLEIRSRKHDPEEILSGIFYILITGIQWRNLSRKYLPKSTCYYWFTKLSKLDAWKETYTQFFASYKKYFSANLNTVSVDGTFVKAVKGGAMIGKTKIRKGTKVMQMVDKEGLLVSLHIDSANPHESRLLMKTIKNYRKVNIRYERDPKLFENFIWIAHCLIFIKKFNIHNDYLVA
ncbi:transposase [Fluviispira sanaruensis]|uniref:Insertion element IS402-like domain-containing protein n=1 Tax=Fluviispira sanaruensis TaxID=2493639 RepID=A0A4P2VG28_FLUSA|nr:transposase [Fluviispira sanaruensis]BBH51666.1 hypothetical protein JCM31447_00830 [Fluviispira sanaruensis]